MNSSQRSSINNTTTYVIWRCLFHNILRWRAFRGELGSLAPTAAHADSYSFQSPAEKVGNDPWRHVKEYWWNIPGSPRFTHPIFFTTPRLSLFHLSASHSVSPVSISLHLSVRPDLRLGVCLPSSVTASLHGRSSLLIAAIWRLRLRPDRCCVPSEQPEPPSPSSPQTKPLLRRPGERGWFAAIILACAVSLKSWWTRRHFTFSFSYLHATRSSTCCCRYTEHAPGGIAPGLSGVRKHVLQWIDLVN